MSKSSSVANILQFHDFLKHQLMIQLTIRCSNKASNDVKRISINIQIYLESHSLKPGSLLKIKGAFDLISFNHSV